MQPNIRIRFSCESLGDLDCFMIPYDLLTVFDHVACEVRLLRIRATLETSGESDQVSRAHAIAQGIFAGTAHIALNGHGGWIGFTQILMDENTIFGFKQNILSRIPCQRLIQISADNLQLAIFRSPENLNIIKPSFGCRAPCQVDCIAEVSRPIGNMIARIPHLSRHCNYGRIFEIVPSEHANCIQRFQDKVLILSRQRIVQVERQDFRSVVRCLKPDDLGVRLVGFG